MKKELILTILCLAIHNGTQSAEASNDNDVSSDHELDLVSPRTTVSPRNADIFKKLKIYAELFSVSKLKEVIFEGANVNSANEHGVTVLMRTIKCGREIDKKDKSLSTPDLIQNFKQRFYDTIHLLIESGANVNAKSKKQISALSLACRYNMHNIVELLLDAGAVDDTQGKNSPLEVAVRKGFTEITKSLLLNHSSYLKNKKDSKFDAYLSKALSLAHKHAQEDIVEMISTLIEKAEKSKGCIIS